MSGGDVPPDLERLRRFAALMDNAFEVPGTGIRFGLDPLLGLLPGLGDVVSALLSLFVVASAHRHRVPARVMARIVVNVVLDLVVGLVPVVGDLVDVAFQENVANVELVVRHRDRTRPPRPAGGFFLVLGTIAAALLVLSAAALALLVAAVKALADRL